MRQLLLRFAIPMLLLSSCGGFAAKDGGSSQPHSGVRGSVVLTPSCPVEIAGSPCPDRPWQGKVQAFTLEDRLVREVNTDERGAFELPLELGTYNLIPYTLDGAQNAKMQQVTVRSGSFTDVTLQVDTGIR